MKYLIALIFLASAEDIALEQEKTSEEIVEELIQEAIYEDAALSKSGS